MTSHDSLTRAGKTKNSDFRSPECLALLDEADIVVPNPSFSLFRKYIKTLVERDKKFLIIDKQNAITYKENNKIWLDYNNPAPKLFYVPEKLENRKNIFEDKDGKLFASFGNIYWFTNLDIQKHHEEMILSGKYDNYNAIEVSKIPKRQGQQSSDLYYQ